MNCFEIATIQWEYRDQSCRLGVLVPRRQVVGDIDLLLSTKHPVQWRHSASNTSCRSRWSPFSWRPLQLPMWPPMWLSFPSGYWIANWNNLPLLHLPYYLLHVAPQCKGYAPRSNCRMNTSIKSILIALNQWSVLLHVRRHTFLWLACLLHSSHLQLALEICIYANKCICCMMCTETHGYAMQTQLCGAGGGSGGSTV